MDKLNRDVLYLIFKELQHNKKTLFTCLKVNKTYCELIIPILWSNPWKYFEMDSIKYKSFLELIIAHLSDKSRNNLKSYFLMNPYQRPLFDYISFCRHLHFDNLNQLVYSAINDIIEDDVFFIVRKDIFDLFINENMKITHLYIPN